MLRVGSATWLLVPGSLLAACNIYNPSLLTGSCGATSATGAGAGGATTGTSIGGAMSTTTGTATGPSTTTVAGTTATGTATTTTATTTGGCTSPSTCPGMDTVCQTRTCNGGMCGFSYQMSGTAAPPDPPGDCQAPVCDGSGHVMNVADPSDPPTTMNQCMTGMCTGTMGMIVPKADGTPCSQNGGAKCSSGSCVQCTVPSDCPSNKCNMNKCVPVILISEVRTRGPGGASDEFVELYNPLTTPVTLGADISLIGRSNSASSYTSRWVGAGQTLPAHSHFLIGGSAYAGPPTADAALVTGITDEASLVLIQGTAGPTQQVIDALCLYCGANPFDATFTCEGTPFNKPSCSSSTNYDAAERKPGAAAGNGTDTQNNANDFVVTSPSNQRNLASPPAP